MKKHILSWSGGKDSTASIILAHLNNEPIDLIVFSEVMFDENISGELPEHIEFIKNKCIPLFEDWGYEVKILHADKTYMESFHHIITRGRHEGMKSGFPMAGRCAINRDCKVKPITQFWKQFKEDDVVQYVGIAIDEPERLKRLEGTNQVSLLAKYGYTEDMAYKLCLQYDLLSPTYTFSFRGGCWFCPNARRPELKHLRECHNDLWQKLLELEQEENIAGYMWNIRNKTSLLELEEEFKKETCLYSLH